MESVSKRTMSNQNTGNTVQQMESEFTPGVRSGHDLQRVQLYIIYKQCYEL